MRENYMDFFGQQLHTRISLNNDAFTFRLPQIRPLNITASPLSRKYHNNSQFISLQIIVITSANVLGFLKAVMLVLFMSIWNWS
jgi:hypothetical protein